MWSPDGRAILFASQTFPDDGGDFTNIWKIALDGLGLTRMTNAPANHYNMEWSPNGKQIVFEESDRDGYHWSEVFVMSEDGSDARNVTNNPANDFRPSWARDGKRILFYSNRTGERAKYSVNQDGSELTSMPESEAETDVQPTGVRDGVYSPDQAKIAYIERTTDFWNIKVISADGTNPRTIASIPGNARHLAWSPVAQPVLDEIITQQSTP